MSVHPRLPALEELRAEKRAERNRSVRTKCRGRIRINSLSKAHKAEKYRLKVGSPTLSPYFCMLCHGYHIDSPTDEEDKNG